jgi:hypothetical protein
MNFKIILIISLIFVSCNKEEIKSSTPVSEKSSASYDFNAKSNTLEKKDDFSDLKKKEEEACDTEEEITKKLAKPKQEPFQLQGGDTGCDVTAEDQT